MQGGKMLRDPDKITDEWIPHYQQLVDSYPLKTLLASGTHGDISPKSGDQVQSFADAIIKYNGRTGAHPKLINAILPQFCHAVDKAQSERPFMRTIRGCFGHSWDVWPVSLSKYVAEMREGERDFLSAEALLTLASQIDDDLGESTRPDRERGEWLWSMLSDHAWNGTNDHNKRHNAGLRRSWSEELRKIGAGLLQQGWNSLGIKEEKDSLMVFNSISISREDLVRVELESEMQVFSGDEIIDSQIVEEDGEKVLYFVSPEISGFGLKRLSLKHADTGANTHGELRATPTELESPYYHLVLDPATGGISSLVHKTSGAELVVSKVDKTLCQTVYFDGAEHKIEELEYHVVAEGPVLARLSVSGSVAGIQIVEFITLYVKLDRVDFDIHINKPVTSKEERLCHVFPVLQDEATLRIETTGAIIRPKPQPEGDLLPGADVRRFAVQGFIDAALPDTTGITIATLDAFVLRLDLDPITFEALGNDQNYREVIKDQNGETNFRFRYSLKSHDAGYDNAEAIAWSRSIYTPLLAVRGYVDPKADNKYSIGLDPKRLIATCLKPAEEDGFIIRIWEIAGKSGSSILDLHGYREAFITDLLERNIEPLQIKDGKVSVNLRANGFLGLRLLP
jgi:hypothetical protein